MSGAGERFVALFMLGASIIGMFWTCDALSWYWYDCSQYRTIDAAYAACEASKDIEPGYLYAFMGMWLFIGGLATYYIYRQETEELRAHE